MSKNARGFDRRSLLKAAAFGTTAIASSAIGALPSKAVESAPRKWDRVADVVIVGTGFAGMTAAITAHDLGASVLVLEKAPEQFKGGNSKVAAGGIFWPNDIEKAKTYFRAMAAPYLDDLSDEFIDVWAKEMNANRDWLQSMGLKFAIVGTSVTAAGVAVGASEFPEMPGADCAQTIVVQGGLGDARLYNGVIEPNVASRKIETLFETPAISLVRRGAEIVGLSAQRGGKTFHIKANRAVVLASGGFENNQVMVRKFLANIPAGVPQGSPYNTGDGIRMAMEVGADLWHMTNVAGPEFAFKAPDIDTATVVLFRKPSYLYIAADGTRFIAEGAHLRMGRHGKINQHGQWVQLPTPVPVHAIFDESVRAAGGIAGNTTGQTNGWDYIHGNKYGWSNDNLREIDKGWIKKADTFADLAKAINVSPDVLQATVARYNQFCANKLDADFGRAPGTMAPIATPPYYAMELVPSLTNTQGGPRRDLNGQIVGVDGNPIPRLYSAGELGSYHAYLYDNGNVAETFASGRIAGRSAAGQKPWKA